MRLSFGEAGEVLAHRARGIDPRGVTPRETVKSISRETTFPEDVTDTELLESSLLELAEDVCRRLRRRRLQARTVTVKIRYSDFATHTRSHTLAKPADVDEIFFREVLALFRKGRTRRYRIRLVGVGVSNLVPRCWQDDLFDQELPLLRELGLKLDVIREKYGRNAIRRGAAESSGSPPGSGPRGAFPRLGTFRRRGVFPRLGTFRRRGGFRPRAVARGCRIPGSQRAPGSSQVLPGYTDCAVISSHSVSLGGSGTSWKPSRSSSSTVWLVPSEYLTVICSMRPFPV